MIGQTLEHWVGVLTTTIIPIIELCGVLIIAFGVVRTIVRYLDRLWHATRHRTAALRLQLGQALVMGLEFQVAADILRTVLDPTWEDIGLLAAIIALRTLLNYFLEREIDLLGHDVNGGVESDG